MPETGLVRDGGLATIGGGNHFVEVQWIERVENRAVAYQWGVREGQLAFMVHSGSRNVGKYIGGMWRDRAQALWMTGVEYPDSRLFPHTPTKFRGLWNILRSHETVLSGLRDKRWSHLFMQEV